MTRTEYKEDTEKVRGTYRCPVCGHRDTESKAPDGVPLVIKCTYCNTGLEVRERGADSLRFTVRVAESF